MSFALALLTNLVGHTPIYFVMFGAFFKVLVLLDCLVVLALEILMGAEEEIKLG